MSGNQTSLLAKLLATENITVQQQPNLKTAMFDLRNRVLMLPIWQGISQDLEDMLIVHETGHALDTPGAEEYKAAADKLAAKIFPGEKVSERLRSTVQGFINVIEDARIDKRQKRRYPGARKNYLIGYKELFERDFFGTANRDINSMNFIDRLNLYFKGGNIHSDITFTPEEKVMLKKVENAETFAEVEALTEEIYLYCKNKLENQAEMENDLIASLAEEGEDDGDADIDGDDWEYIDDDSEEGAQASRGEGEKSEGDLSQDGSGHQGGQSDIPSNAPVARTDEAWQQKSQDIVKNENSVFVYLDMPLVNWDKAVHDYKKVLSEWRNDIDNSNRWRTITTEYYNQARKEMTQWKMKEKETISFLVKEFEQRKAAELYAKINIAKTGVIDTNKLHTYKYNDDIFRRITTIPKGKNHGFVMFIDWSGSMHYNLRNTIKQLFSLCLFCKQINVPFEVYAFKDCGADNPFSYLNKQNVIAGSNLVLRNFLSSRMNVEDFNFAMTCLWHASDYHGNLATDGLGGTPLNEALMIAPKIINDFTARNKLEITNVIVLSDGESNPSSGIKNETTPRVHGQTRKYFYVDPATRKTYDWQQYGYGYREGNTSTLLRIIKDNTGCNLVGFYLYDGKFSRLDREFNVSNGNNEAFLKARKFYSDNKFYPVRSAGYDEYYVIDSSALRNDSNELAIDNTGDKKMTTKKMVSAFTKFAQKKTVNRVLLRQFSEKIAGHSKKVA